jgi:hypothetical protein
MASLPPCGIYRTTRALDEIPAGALVYFHNHGDPGPGIYLPHRWHLNRAEWHSQGKTLADLSLAATLEPLPAEGLYRVSAPFTCCEKRCRTFEAETLVQLGYTRDAEALLFVPEWTSNGLAIPEKGTAIDRSRLAKMARLIVAEPREAASPGSAGASMH